MQVKRPIQSEGKATAQNGLTLASINGCLRPEIDSELTYTAIVKQG